MASPAGKVGECHENVVFGVDPEDFFGSHFFSPALCRRYRLNVTLNVSTVKPAAVRSPERKYPS